MDYEYPLLNKVFEKFVDKKRLAKDCYLACCQHLLEPQLEMFKRLVEFGFDPSRILVLGKIYSTNDGVLEELRDIGIRVFQPSFSVNSFDAEHSKNCKMLVDLLPSNARCIVLDDGAELIKTCLDNNREVLFAVEQTSSGFRKLEDQKLKFPVINVARSVTKLTQETPAIIRDAMERVIKYSETKKIIHPSFFIIGLGPIGEAMREICKIRGFSVEGFDIKLGHTDLVNAINTFDPDVIIGATGSSVLTKEDIEQLQTDKPIYLMSVSSSDREFPVVYFRTNEHTHDDIQYKNITFVNNGFPINFTGNKNELTPTEIEKTICLLGGSVIYCLIENISGNGLVEVPAPLEACINQ